MRQIIVDFGYLELMGRRLPLQVYGYGLMMVLGFLVAIYLAQWRARRSGENSDIILHCGLLALAGGVLGARGAYIIQHWDQFAASDNLLGAMLNVTSGGLIYYGGVILASLMVVLYLWRKKAPLRRYLDIVAVSLMVGLAFGRAGCLLNGCCYGGQTHDHDPLGQRFPLYSQPLVKLSSSPGPFAASTEGPSPVYSHQYHRNQVQPDDRLMLLDNRLRLPREFHGKLAGDQMATLLAPADEVDKSFRALAGPDGRVSHEEWERGLAGGEGFLRGSEAWSEAMLFDRSGDEHLSLGEAREYLARRLEHLRHRFDADAGGSLEAAEIQAANAWLQSDLYELAGHQWSHKVKPAQLLALINALVIAGVLAGFYRIRTREGQVFALLLILYPITRFILESIRDDNPHNLLQGILTHNQYTSLVMAGVGIALFLALKRLPASAGPAWAQRQAQAAEIKAGRRGKNG